MSVGSRFRLRMLATSAIALGLLAGSVPIAAASDNAEGSRAVSVEGNVDKDQRNACERAGLAGTSYGGEAVEFDATDRFLTITEVLADIEVSGIVVKGGPAYNVYKPGEDGMSAEPVWKKLHSPEHPRPGKIPGISHWFLCGTPDDSPDTTPPETTTPPVETTPPGETTPPETTPPEGTTPGTTPPGSTPPETTSTTDSRGPSSAPGTSTTTSQDAVAPAGDTDDLASTGFGQAWLLGVGALLLAGGGALVMLARKRRTDG